MTRIQRERFTDVNEYERLKDSYVLTPEKLIPAKSDLAILHPLPRVNEISVKVDDDPRACYFRQALCGKYIRMALILKLLREGSDGKPSAEAVSGTLIHDIRCRNPQCITAIEQELENVFRVVNTEKKICRCLYCEAKEYYNE
jgi:aspartate carbamoyltransferase catalytic subunit